ncbi:MAG: hypothetical protein ACJA1H_000387 [Glaciecola sp.]|jgi:hypothetical protein
MKDSKKNFEDYLRHIINDTRFDDFISEILDSFSLIELKKNDFFVEEGKICMRFCFIES